MLSQPLHPLRLLKQNSRVPKSACRCSSSVTRDRSELYGSHSCLLCIRPPGLLNISKISKLACGYDPAADALPESCILSGGQVRAILPPNSSEVDRRVFSAGISESTRHEHSHFVWLKHCMSFMKPPCVTLTGPRSWRLLYFAGTVKLLVSPGKARGLPIGN